MPKERALSASPAAELNQEAKSPLFRGARLRTCYAPLNLVVTSLRAPANPTCLIVEDEPLIARALARQLGAMGVRAHAATSLAELRGLTGPFDGAIVDLDLPDGSGLDIETCLPRDSIRSSIVFFSATTQAEARQEAALRGVFVPKAHGTVQALRALAGQLARPRQGVGSGTYARISGLPVDDDQPESQAGSRLA